MRIVTLVGRMAAGLALVAGPVAAQGVVAGTVQDEIGRVLAGARVRALPGERVTESDEKGAFRLTGVAADARIEVRRIGFRPETLAARAGAPLAVTLRRTGQMLDPMVVEGRRDLSPALAGFYHRREQGHGRFFTAEEIERRSVYRMSDLLRNVPGLRVDRTRAGRSVYRIRGAVASPVIWLDGVPMGGLDVDLDAFDPRTFAGIEIYSGMASVPPQFNSTRLNGSQGGTIVLWTKEGQPRPRRRRPGDPTPAELLAKLLEESRVYTADAVDMPARLIGGAPLQPIYPDSLYDHGVVGQVEVEFVVDQMGRVRMETFGVVATTHPALGEAVRRALEVRSWVPATRSGSPVQQLVQLPFAFLPDDAAARKPQD